MRKHAFLNPPKKRTTSAVVVDMGPPRKRTSPLRTPEALTRTLSSQNTFAVGPYLACRLFSRKRVFSRKRAVRISAQCLHSWYQSCASSRSEGGSDTFPSSHANKQTPHVRTPTTVPPPRHGRNEAVFFRCVPHASIYFYSAATKLRRKA